MADFSIIVQSPEVRSIVQDNYLERQFHDALFPEQLFRESTAKENWPAGGVVGDMQIFTGTGLIPVDLTPVAPRTDPTVATYQIEQWEATLGQLGKSIDTDLPTDANAIASLFMQNAQILGMHAGQTMNRLARNEAFAIALSGHTVADGAQSGVTTLRVKRLNGFTRARRPDLPAGAKVRFETVSASNPLKIRIYDTTPAEVSRTVTGFTPDVAGDEYGPGTLTLAGGAVTVSDRAYVIAEDRTALVRVGGGNKVDDVGSSDVPTLADVRTMVARFRQSNVRAFADGTYHAHMDPISEAKLLNDTEFQRMMTSLPDSHYMQAFALGRMMGTTFIKNTEAPNTETVVGGLTATYSQQDPFVGELYNNGTTTGTPIHRILFSGVGGLIEYSQDVAQYKSPVGMAGEVVDPRITANSIQVNTDRIKMIIRGPQNRNMDQVSTTWRWVGAYAKRTDATTGSAARYKRIGCIEHGE
jgi:hypothetical protein